MHTTAERSTAATVKRLVLTLLLASFCSSVAADWVLVGEMPNDDSPVGGYAVYVDPLTVIRSDETVTLLFLVNYKAAQSGGLASNNGKTFLSQKVNWEFHCNDKLWRMLYFSAHSEQMARGEAVYHGDGKPTDWFSAVPATMMEVFWKFACRK